MCRLTSGLHLVKIEFNMDNHGNLIPLAAMELGYTESKHAQYEVIQRFLQGHDVFGVLLTGFGELLLWLASVPSDQTELNHVLE